jgi:hypothetical protein
MNQEVKVASDKSARNRGPCFVTKIHECLIINESLEYCKQYELDKFFIFLFWGGRVTILITGNWTDPFSIFE